MTTCRHEKISQSDEVFIRSHHIILWKNGYAVVTAIERPQVKLLAVPSSRNDSWDVVYTHMRLAV